MKYSPEIDGLRTLAIIPIFLYHANFNFLKGGYVGVDIFFVISGYLITANIMKEIEQGIFSFLSFYERRARRLLPALYFVLISVFICSYISLLSLELKDFCKSLVATPVFVSNILFMRESGYFDISTELKPLIHTWSLSVEEQYYLIYPLLLFLLCKYLRNNLIYFLIFLCLLSFLSTQIINYENKSVLFYSLITRFWELLLGGLIVFRDKLNAKWIIGNSFFSFFGFILIFFSLILFDKNLHYPGFLAVIPTLGTFFMIVGKESNNFLNAILRSKIFVFVGSLSYGIYLWHQPLLALAKNLTLDDVSVFMVCSIMIFSILLAYFTRQYVEIPFIYLRPKFYSFVNYFFVVFGFLLIAIGLMGYYSNGFANIRHFKNLPGNYLNQLSITHNMRGVDGNACVAETASVCRVNFAPDRDKILLIGDSHSADFSMAYKNYVISKNLDAYEESVGGCAFAKFQVNSSLGCMQARNLIESLAESDRFSIVIFVSNLSNQLTELPLKEKYENLESIFLLLKTFSDKGSKVFIFQSRPNFNHSPSKAIFLDVSNKLQVKPDSFDWNEFLLSHNHISNLYIVNQSDYLVSLGCGYVSCFNGHTIEMLPLYRDNNHLTSLGAELVFDKFLKNYLY